MALQLQTRLISFTQTMGKTQGTADQSSFFEPTTPGKRVSKKKEHNPGQMMQAANKCA